jgi:hypothetical protein
MQEARVEEPACNYFPDYRNECGWPTLSIFYFISLSMVTTFLFLNLFVAVLLNSFKSTADIIPPPITQNEIAELADLWSSDAFKKQGWLAMDPVEFITFVETLPAPFGLDRKRLNPVLAPEDTEIYSYVRDCAVPLRSFTQAELAELTVIEGATAQLPEPVRRPRHVDVSFDDDAQPDAPIAFLYIHFVDAIMGIVAMRFRRAFGANFDPGAIPVNDREWKLMQQRYTGRFQLTHDTVAMPMVGLFAIRVIWGHWQLMRHYYFRVKHAREMARQREWLQFADGYGEHVPEAKPEPASEPVSEASVVHAEEPDALSSSSSEEDEEPVAEAEVVQEVEEPAPSAPHVDPLSMLREMVLLTVDDPHANTAIRLNATQRQQHHLAAAFSEPVAGATARRPAEAGAAPSPSPAAQPEAPDSPAAVGGPRRRTDATTRTDPMESLYASLRSAFTQTIDDADRADRGQRVKDRQVKDGGSSRKKKRSQPAPAEPEPVPEPEPALDVGPAIDTPMRRPRFPQRPSLPSSAMMPVTAAASAAATGTPLGTPTLTARSSGNMASSAAAAGLSQPKRSNLPSSPSEQGSAPLLPSTPRATASMNAQADEEEAPRRKRPQQKQQHDDDDYDYYSHHY